MNPFTSTPTAVLPWGSDFPPLARDDVVLLTFDFAALLPPGVSIASIVATSCIVSRWSTSPDADAASRLIGSPTIGTSPGTGSANAAISQMFGNGVRNVVYIVTALANITNGEIINMHARATCL